MRYLSNTRSCSKPSTTHCRDVHFRSQCIRKVLKPQLSNYSFSFQLARWCNQEIALCSIYLSKTKTEISKTRLSFQFQFNLILHVQTCVETLQRDYQGCQLKNLCCFAQRCCRHLQLDALFSMSCHFFVYLSLLRLCIFLFSVSSRLCRNHLLIK